ncbi:MAG: tetratricopeptide repeat protein [Candidatus Marinimicrobia bacterium]|nr:tetratricopeptide repeat protein [Candidatus Neomarinimicrobiota bacterium]
MRKIIKIASLGVIIALAGLVCESQEFVSAKMYVQQGDLEAAEKFFLQALEVPADASNALIPYLLASQVYVRQQRYEEMSEMLAEALRRNPTQNYQGHPIAELVENIRQVQWQEEYQRGANLFNEIISQVEGQSLDDNQRQGLLAAKEHFETAILIWPDQAPAYASLVLCYRQLGDEAGESAALDKALEMDPDDGQVLLLAGERALKAGETVEAVKYYQRAQKNDPENILIMQRLTSLYIELGDLQAALEILEETQKNSPRDPNTYFNIGAVYSNIANDALRKGQDIYREVVSAIPIDNEQLAIAMELFKQAQGAYSEALYFMDNTLALDPDDAAADLAIREIQKTKKILDTVQRSVEQMLQ